MHISFLVAITGLCALLLYKVLSLVTSKIQDRRQARVWGCQDAPALPSRNAGLDHIAAMKAADDAKRFPDYMIEREQEVSRYAGRPVSTFSSTVLGQKMFFTSDPRNIQAMLATKFPDFDLGPTRHAIMSDMLGDGIFSQDGRKWEHSRALLRPNFAREQVSDLEMEERHVQALFQILPTQADGWTSFTNIQGLFFRLTIDAATEFLFGHSIHSQLRATTAEQDEKSFSANFDQAQTHMARKFRLVDLQWTYNPKEYRANKRVINRFASDYVQRALDERSSEDGDKGRSNERYVFLEELAKQTRDPEELRAQLLNILFAGRDTTASLLSWCFHLLLRNQEVFTKLRDSIIDTFGTEAVPKEPITFSSLKDCRYLQYTLDETLRLWTVVPANGRRTNKRTFLPHGGGADGEASVFLPANTHVDYSSHVMHRRKEVWGDDADEFKPERFEGRRRGWEFLPFSGGPRICIGQQFALTEAGYVIVRLLQRFDGIEAPGGSLEKPTRTAMTLTSSPGDPVTLRLHKARE